MQDFLRARDRDGVTIADLTVVGDDEQSRELIVGVVANGADRRGAEDLIVRWAAAVGQRQEYHPGTWGPPDADRLVERIGGWHDPVA